MKYDVRMSCGHEEIVTLFGKGSEREIMITYLENQGLCKKCYTAERRRTEKEMGLAFHASFFPGISNKGELLICLWFDGDSYSHKETIKAMDYFYDTVPCPEPLKSSKKAWMKLVTLEEFPGEVATVVEKYGVDMPSLEDALQSSGYLIALRAKEKFDEEKKKLKDIPKPVVPEILKGHKWNQKIYGKHGNYSVYPDGVKTTLTDTQAEEIRQYILDKDAYQKKVDAIRNQT